MFRFSKRFEYALMATQYLGKNSEYPLITAREISEKYNISFILLSRILQELKKHNIVKSVQGKKGGYKLSKKTSTITLLEIIQAVDKKSNLLPCLKKSANKKDCIHLEDCSIRYQLNIVQNKVFNVLVHSKLSDFI